MKSLISASVRTPSPGASSDLQILDIGRADANSLAIWIPVTSGSMSAPSDR